MQTDVFGKKLHSWKLLGRVDWQCHNVTCPIVRAQSLPTRIFHIQLWFRYM
jgi:hypothetical protein